MNQRFVCLIEKDNKCNGDFFKAYTFSLTIWFVKNDIYNFANIHQRFCCFTFAWLGGEESFFLLLFIWNYSLNITHPMRIGWLNTFFLFFKISFLKLFALVYIVRQDDVKSFSSTMVHMHTMCNTRTTRYFTVVRCSWSKE